MAEKYKSQAGLKRFIRSNMRPHRSLKFFSFINLIDRLYHTSETTMIPMMTPYRPIAVAKISTMSIFMKVPFWLASVRAAPEPTTPTEMPDVRLVRPTMAPDQKTLYALIFTSS